MIQGQDINRLEELWPLDIRETVFLEIEAAESIAFVVFSVEFCRVVMELTRAVALNGRQDPREILGWGGSF